MQARQRNAIRHPRALRGLPIPQHHLTCALSVAVGCVRHPREGSSYVDIPRWSGGAPLMEQPGCTEPGDAAPHHSHPLALGRRNANRRGHRGAASSLTLEADLFENCVFKRSRRLCACAQCVCRVAVALYRRAVFMPPAAGVVYLTKTYNQRIHMHLRSLVGDRREALHSLYHAARPL
jgi:hypothetical protein